jgi:hypothetical protein
LRDFCEAVQFDKKKKKPSNKKLTIIEFKGGGAGSRYVGLQKPGTDKVNKTMHIQNVNFLTSYGAAQLSTSNQIKISKSSSTL